MPTDFAPFARPDTCAGKTRRTGVEIEFAGLSEREVATLLQDALGGDLSDSGPHEVTVCGSALGDLRIELDTALRKIGSGQLLNDTLEVMRGLVPVEIITGPLTPDEVARLNGLLPDLRRAGAIGSRAGVLLGFGVHLNPEVTGLDDAHTLATIRAYALLEPWLRHREGLDMTRRALPFVDPWPRALIKALIATPPDTLEDAMALYARHVDSRNHGLDLLPLFKHAAPEGFAVQFEDSDSIGARPTFHFRLPESRIDEADWSLAQSWKLWRAVEALAYDPARLQKLCTSWKDYHDNWLEGRGDWVTRCDKVMAPLLAAEGA